MPLSEDEELELLELEEQEYQASKIPKSPKGPSEWESAGRGLAQGASFGLRDEGAGLLKNPSGALKEIANKFGANFSDEDIEEYRRERDASRGLDLAAKEANPKSFAAGELGGAIGTSFIPGLGLAKGAGLAKTAATAAAQGAAYGLGGSEADNATDLALDTLKGGGLGAAGGAAGYGLGKLAEKGIEKAGSLIGKTANPLSRTAEKLAENATGATGRQSAQFADDAGRELLDRGLVQFGDTPGKVAQRVSAANDDAGRAISTALEGLDNQGVRVDLHEIKRGIQQQIEDLSSVPGNEKIVRELERELQNLVSRGESSLPVSVAEKAKRNFQGQTNFNSSNAEKSATGIVSDLFKNKVEDTALAADPALGNAFTEGKKTYGLLKPIQEAAEKRAATMNQSPLGGLGDWAAIGAGGVGAGPVGAAAGLIGKKVIAPRLASSGAVTADMLSKMAASAPEQLGKFAPIFQNASQRGAQAVAATHFVLEQQNPEYREMMKKIREGEDGVNDPLATSQGGIQ